MATSGKNETPLAGREGRGMGTVPVDQVLDAVRADAKLQNVHESGHGTPRIRHSSAGRPEIKLTGPGRERILAILPEMPEDRRR